MPKPPPLPQPPPPPPRTPTRADASVLEAGQNAEGAATGIGSLITTGPMGLRRKASTQKASLLGQ